MGGEDDMPYKAKKLCRHPGCPNLIESGKTYCEEHSREYERKRGNSAQRGYDHRWRKARKMFLKEHPLCVMCEKEGKTTPATEVHHVIPFKGDMSLFWDESNWVALCKRCHSRITATEDSGFGNGSRI